MIIEDILIQAGVDMVPAKGGTDDVLMPCPLCSGLTDVNSERRVLGVNLVNGKAHCFRCDWKSGGVVRTAKMLCEAFGIEFSWRLRASCAIADETTITASEPEEIPLPTGLPAEYERFSDKNDFVMRKARAYLKSRQITDEMIHRYRIGFAGAGELAWRVLFPVVGEDKRIYGCVGRDFSGQSHAKYLNTKGIKILYGGNQTGDTAVIVEGAVDAVRASQYLRDLPSIVAVAVLGSTITTLQIAQLAKYKKIIHFPDADRPGVKGAMSRAAQTFEAGLETWVVIPESMSGRDPDSMGETEFLSALRGAHQWSQSTKMRLRLSALKEG